ncbi:hypothetical protein AC249_AIPGENE5006 [Exaiptasia diaphana]|nr:hypothetical protein AC249_AIPGENE5006 [Exaiptasia diaphana]
MVMAVIVNKDEAPNIHVLPSRIVNAAKKSNLYAFILVYKSTQKLRCTKAPTPKSAMAKQRIRIYEGVRIDGVLTKVKMIKKFKTQATRELQALIIISEIAKPASSLVGVGNICMSC